MQNSVKKNTLYNLIKSCSSLIFPLITFPYISRVLLAENVGKINFGQSIVSYVSLIASLGVTTYAVRECSRVKSNKKLLGHVASQIFSINIVTTFIAYLLFGVTLLVARPLEDYKTLICIQSITVLLSTLGADWLNNSVEDFKYITVRTLLFQAFSLIAMFAFVHRPEDYMKYAIINVMSSSGANIANMFYRRKYCRTKFTLKMALRKHLPPIILLFAMVLSQTIFCNSDITILGLVRGDYEVGLYSTSVKIYNIVNTMIASVAWVIMPRISYYFSIKEYSEINKLVKYSLNFMVVLGLPCIVAINMLCPEIIEIIAGKEYLGATTSLHILTASLAVSLIGGLITNIILLPARQEKVCLKACLMAALVNILVNIIVVPKFGLNAAAVTTVISEIISLGICLRSVDKNIRINGLKEVLVGPCAGCIGIIAVVIVVSKITDALWVKSLVSIILGALLYLLILIVLKNKFVINMIAPFFRRLKNR